MARRILIGRYGILPTDLYEMSLYDIYIMIDAYNYCAYEDQDKQYKLASWVTAAVINGCGQSKKKIKPSQLYKGIDVYKAFSKNSANINVKSYVESEREKLKAIFNLET